MLSHEPLQLPFKIQEFNEDMVVALDRNFAAIEQALSRIQVYHNMPEFHKILEGSESAKSYLHEYGDVKMFRQQITPPLGSGPDEAAENDFWIYYENGNPVWKQVKQGNWEHVNLRPTQGDSVDMLAVVGIDAEIITAGYIRAGRIEAGSITGDKINAFTTIIAGEGNEIGALSGVGNYRIYAGHAQASAAPFSVYKDGAIYSSSGLIGGWSIDGEAGLKLGALGNTRGIATGDYTFYAGDASPEHAPFSVTKEGNLIASTGSLNALNLGEPGATAGLFISNTNLGYFDGGTWKTYMDNTGSFYLGGANGSLTWDGSSLTIDGSGKFTGELIANSGFIGGTGGWIIESGRIYSQDIELKTGVGTNGYIRNNNNRWIFYNDGSGQLASGTLSWTAAGVLTLTGGFLGGANKVQIDASGLDVGSLGSIRGGATGVTTGNGFWMGYAGGAYQFRIGTTSGANSIRWDGSILSIRGALNADDIVAGTIVADSVDSGWVYTNSIHATQITAGYINTDRIEAGSITATKIASNAITTNKISAGAVTSDEISVTDLSAISGSFSTLTAGGSWSWMHFYSSGGLPYMDVLSGGYRRIQMTEERFTFYDSTEREAGHLEGTTTSGYKTIWLRGTDYCIARAEGGGRLAGLMGKTTGSGGDTSAALQADDGSNFSMLSVRANGLYGHIEGDGEIHVWGGSFDLRQCDLYVRNHTETSISPNAAFGSITGRLRRSTSHPDYKGDIEPLEISYAENFIDNCSPIWYKTLCAGDRKDWGYYGYNALELAEIDPRLAQYENDEAGAEGQPPGEVTGINHVLISSLLHVIVKDNRERIAELERRLEEGEQRKPE